MKEDLLYFFHFRNPANKMNIKNDRFREMEHIGSLVTKETSKLSPIINDLSFFKGDRLEQYVLSYFRKKVGKKPVRSYLVWKLSEYLNHYQEKYQKSNLLFSQKLPLVFELIITIQYLHNHILDEKYGSVSNNHPVLWKNLISSNVLREVLFTYLETEVNPLLKPQQRIFLRRAIAKLFCQVDVGQRIDKHYNSYTKWKNGLPLFDAKKWLGDDRCRQLMTSHINQTKKRIHDGYHFTDIYFHRIYLTNVCLFRTIAEVVTKLSSNVPKRKKEELINFSILYGFMMQIINDYADFAYSSDDKEQQRLQTAAKKTTDVFADLYNFNITLPLIIHLQKNERRKIEAYLEKGERKKRPLQQFPLQIMNEIIDTGGIRACVALSRDLEQAANSHLDKENPASKYLVNMTDIARNNKFYKIFNLK